MAARRFPVEAGHVLAFARSLHTDEIYATKIAGYPSVFAHGMLTMGLTGQAIAGLVVMSGYAHARLAR